MGIARATNLYGVTVSSRPPERSLLLIERLIYRLATSVRKFFSVLVFSSRLANASGVRSGICAVAIDRHSLGEEYFYASEGRGRTASSCNSNHESVFLSRLRRSTQRGRKSGPKIGDTVDHRWRYQPSGWS